MTWLKANAGALSWLVAMAVIGVLFARQQGQVDDLHDLAVSNRVVSTQLCEVVVDVHDGRVREVQTQTEALAQTLNYLRNATPQEVASGLPARVRANLPRTRAAVESAMAQERATRPPAECVRRAQADRTP